MFIKCPVILIKVEDTTTNMKNIEKQHPPTPRWTQTPRRAEELDTTKAWTLLEQLSRPSWVYKMHVPGVQIRFIVWEHMLGIL